MKTSFKTTTLIAAIGMSIAVGFSLIVQFINSFTGIDLYAHPVRMQGLWRVEDVVWWASALMFFWGIFRYPDQLPKLNKCSKRIGIAIIGIIVFLYFDGLSYSSTTDPIWLRIIRYTLRFIADSGYVAALWWCYAKSADRRAGAISYISLATALLCGTTILLLISNAIVWWNKIGPLPLRFYWYDSMFVLHSIIYISAAACGLIGIYSRETTLMITDEKYKKLKRTTIVGWLLLASFILDVVLLVTLVYHPIPSDEILIGLLLFFFAIPVIAGIYLLIACRTLQKAYDTIKEQEKQLEETGNEQTRRA